jgi:hypothetical protein
MEADTAPIGVGILTKGKPTLSMVLVSLLMQDGCPLRVHIVDTAPSPVVRRDDVVFALRLAFDRQIVCEYEYSREKDPALTWCSWTTTWCCRPTRWRGCGRAPAGCAIGAT